MRRTCRSQITPDGVICGTSSFSWRRPGKRALSFRRMALLRSAHAPAPRRRSRAIVPRTLDMGEPGICSMRERVAALPRPARAHVNVQVEHALTLSHAGAVAQPANGGDADRALVDEVGARARTHLSSSLLLAAQCHAGRPAAERSPSLAPDAAVRCVCRLAGLDAMMTTSEMSTATNAPSGCVSEPVASRVARRGPPCLGPRAC